MTRLPFASLLLMTAAVPAATLAQTVAPATGPAQTVSPAPATVTRAEVIAKLDGDFADLDGDKNGKATRAEVEQRISVGGATELAILTKRRDDAFKKFDLNGDGQLSRSEFDAGAPLPKVRSADAAPVLTRFDTNKDGSITNAEFRAPTLANFDKLDSDKDGKLTATEQRAAPGNR